MKHFQQNLLIVLALALCGLCAFQWHGQTVQRQEITTLNGMVSDKNIAIQSAANSIATLNHQVNQMDARLTELKAAAATNAQLIVTQKLELERLQFANAGLTDEIAQYKSAVTTMTARLKEAYAGIAKQNEAITNLVARRDDMVKKYSDSVKDRNEVVIKYNALVERIQKQENSGAPQ